MSPTSHKQGATAVFQKHLKLETQGHRDMHDLTDPLLRVVEQSGVRTGIAHVFVVGSTGALGTIEFEPGLQSDLPQLLDRLVPPGAEYGHERAWNDGNAHSHLQSTLLGPSVSVPVDGGRLLLGNWQQVIFLECDTRPRERTLVVTVIGV
jgi:secondary thiamine-phosphate synthase enzyme